MKLLIAILIILTSMTMAFWGCVKGFEDMEQIRVFVPVPYPVIEHEVKLVEVEKEVVVFEKAVVEQPIEKIVYEPIFIKDWESVEQFQEWFEGLALQPLRSMDPVYLVDCEDYVLRVQREAVKQGYIVSLALVKSKYYFGVKVLEDSKPHAGMLISAGNVFYYIDFTYNSGGSEISRITRVAQRD